MFFENIPGVYQSALFNNFPVIHGFSGKMFGDMRESASRRKLVKTLKYDTPDIKTATQVHGSKILSVDGYSSVDVGDALETADAGIIVGVKSADCVPVLLYDTVTHRVAAVHSGWKGTLAKITLHTVHDISSSVHSLYAAIGPSILDCCYDVDGSRGERFMKAYAGNPSCVVRIGSTYRLNLANCIQSDLMNIGISAHHIDTAGICTSCNHDSFFSYRYTYPDSCGMNMSFIGIYEKI